MLQFNVKVSLYKKNEETNRRDLVFPYDSAFARKTEEEIYRALDGVFLIDGEYNVYVFSIDNVERSRDD